MFIAAVACAAAAGAASAATVDFEGLTTSYVIANSISSGGFTFAPSQGQVGVVARGNICSPTCADDGTATLIFGIPSGTYPASTPPLVVTGPAAFSLTSFAYGELGVPPYAANATSLTVVGTLVGGGTLSRQLAIDGIADGAGGLADFQTATFDTIFAQSLFSSVAISGRTATGAAGGFALDNLVVSYAPEPAAWMTLVVGFGAVGAGLRRGRRTAPRPA